MSQAVLPFAAGSHLSFRRWARLHRHARTRFFAARTHGFSEETCNTRQVVFFLLQV